VNREVCITGYGLISPLGETPEAWWTVLNDPAAAAALVDSETYAPFHVAPIGEYDLAAQVPKRGDQRAMEPMMQYGTYAAGLALDIAGLKGNEELLGETHLVVAAGGGERDWELDQQIMEELPGRNDKEAFLNQQLSDGLRPTLFLAQLPNLFAGNISLIHKVSGSSRTFMGEELAGFDALRISASRIRAGQADICLVGAGYNGARPDMMFTYHAGNILLTGDMAPLWNRPDAGIVLGSAGAFLVLESRERAASRGADVYARIGEVRSGRSARKPGNAAANARGQFDEIAPGLKKDGIGILSGASGFGPVTGEEKEFLGEIAGTLGGAPVRGMAQACGHAMEAAFLQNMVLAVAMLGEGKICAPLNDDPLETVTGSVPVSQYLVTSWGHLAGEGMAVVETADD
jgi:3-oxoacyl-[acyl-carrier-protein] synthase II